MVRNYISVSRQNRIWANSLIWLGTQHSWWMRSCAYLLIFKKLGKTIIMNKSVKRDTLTFKLHWFVCVCVCMLSCVWLFVIRWTVACLALPSMEFSRQEYWSGLSFPTARDIPDPGIKPASPALAGRFCTTVSPRKYSFVHSLTKLKKKSVN